MPYDTLTWVTAGLVAVLASYAMVQLRSSNNGPAEKDAFDQEEQTLAHVSRLWTGNETELDFRDIARIWRTTPEARAEPKPPPSFRHPEIQQFHAQWVAHPVVKAEKRAIIEGILSLLDREGDCPSVVQKNSSEAEKKYDPNVFDKLATIPLWRHSLEVATHITKAMTQAMLIPDALIAGLGHDLGKIPVYQDSLYRTGDHPIVSIIVLNKIPGYESMTNREDVSLSIRQHHLLATESVLGRALKDADQQVRLMEISTLTPDLSSTEQSSGDTLASAPTATARVCATVPLLPNKEAKGNKDRQNHEAQDIDLATLDLDHLLQGLRKRINRLEKNRWSIISVPEGWVLSQSDVLWNEVKRLAKNAPAFLAADANEETKREMLHMLVQRLITEKQAIATELLGEGYYTTQCLIITESGRSMRVPLIPFRVEAFGATPSALEKLKHDTLRLMVKKVKVAKAHQKASQE